MLPREYDNDLYLSYAYDLPPFDPWIHSIFQIGQALTYCFFAIEEYILVHSTVLYRVLWKNLLF